MYWVCGVCQRCALMLIAAPNRITNNVGRGDAERGSIIGPERTIQVPAELVERCYLNR
jgi:hypothetical protein